MTGNYLIEEGPQNRWIVPVSSADNDTPALAAYTDTAHLRLCVKYSAATSASDASPVQKDVWSSVDLVKLFERARQCKPERDPSAPERLNVIWLPGTWFKDNVHSEPALTERMLWRQGPVLYLDESSYEHKINRRGSDEPQWPLDTMHEVQIYTIGKLVLGDSEKVRVDVPGVLGVVRDSDPTECWFTTTLPEDLGGGIGVVGFTITDAREMVPGAKAALPFTILFDAVTFPIQLPFMLLGAGQAARIAAEDK